MAVIRLDPVDLEVCGPLYSMESHHESSWAISDDDGVTSSLRSDDGCDSRVAVPAAGWTASQAALPTVGQAVLLELASLRGRRVASGLPHSWSYSCRVKDFALIVRVAIPVDAMASVVELVEVAPNASTMRLINLLVDIRVGVAWWVAWVDDVVASCTP